MAYFGFLGELSKLVLQMILDEFEFVRVRGDVGCFNAALIAALVNRDFVWEVNKRLSVVSGYRKAHGRRPEDDVSGREPIWNEFSDAELLANWRPDTVKWLPLTRGLDGSREDAASKVSRIPPVFEENFRDLPTETTVAEVLAPGTQTENNNELTQAQNKIAELTAEVLNFEEQAACQQALEEEEISELPQLQGELSSAEETENDDEASASDLGADEFEVRGI